MSVLSFFFVRASPLQNSGQPHVQLSPSLILRYGGATDRGLKRSENQDALGRFPDSSLDPRAEGGLLFIVADGMGGHRGGREASTMAVQMIADEFYANTAGEIEDRLSEAFATVNQEIFRRSRVEQTLEGMGTTCTALVVAEGRLVIGHVGDSRAYRITDGGVVQLTEDHSYVGEMVRQKLITQEKAELHPHRNVLLKAFGAREEVEMDLVTDIDASEGDRYLLCSDGLSGVSREEIRDAVLSADPQDAAEKLVDLANQAGGLDNVTVQIIEFVAGKES